MVMGGLSSSGRVIYMHRDTHDLVPCPTLAMPALEIPLLVPVRGLDGGHFQHSAAVVASQFRRLVVALHLHWAMTSKRQHSMTGAKAKEEWQAEHS